MKKLIISLMMVVFMLTTTGMVSANNTDVVKPEKPHYRGAYWGMSKNEVKKTLKENDEMIEYEDSILVTSPDFEYGVSYFFTDNKLTHGILAYNEKHMNKNLYLDEYYQMQGVLSEKYGESVTDEMKWKGDLFKDDVQHYGLAISTGDLFCFTTWEVYEDNDEVKVMSGTDGGAVHSDYIQSVRDGFDNDLRVKTTDIRLMIFGDNYEVSVGVVYQSAEFWHLVEEEVKEKNDNNF